MKPKDLLQYLEKDDRTIQDLKRAGERKTETTETPFAGNVNSFLDAFGQAALRTSSGLPQSQQLYQLGSTQAQAIAAWRRNYY